MKKFSTRRRARSRHRKESLTLTSTKIVGLTPEQYGNMMLDLLAEAIADVRRRD